MVDLYKEINFWSKLYSKRLLKGSPLSCTSLEEVTSSPQYGYRYLNEMKEIYILSRSVEADILKKYCSLIRSIL